MTFISACASVCMKSNILSHYGLTNIKGKLHYLTNNKVLFDSFYRLE